MAPFVVFALPRSRTKWLSAFLSYTDWRCGHDEAIRLRSVEDVKSWFAQPNTGTVETGVAPFWRLIQSKCPDVRFVTIRRRVDEAIASTLAAAPIGNPDALVKTLRATDAKLTQIERRAPDVLSVRYEDLVREDVCATVFEHCLPYAHDSLWWSRWKDVVVSGDLFAQRRYAEAHLPQIMKMCRTAKQASLAAMARPSKETEGMTFQVERFDHWYADAAPLFRDHMVITGQGVEDFSKKNIALARRIDQVGMMQIVTARLNGRMFGYLLSIISPSLDSETWMAQHLPFYASPEFPGLGMKLQREATTRLQAMGVSDVFARSGVRGSGPRLGAMYKRLGYEDYGRLHRLGLKDTAQWA